jgi:Lon protease-like protein
MLDDIRPGNNLFGLSYFDASTSEKEFPSVGSIGCVAKVTDTQAFPDGRSNILTVGVIRYWIEEYVERGNPYLVARVSYFEDEADDSEAVGESSREVAETFTRIARAVRTINDERANLPDIADTEPQRLSFLVAAAMEVDTDVKQDLSGRGFTSWRRAMVTVAGELKSNDGGPKRVDGVRKATSQCIFHFSFFIDG